MSGLFWLRAASDSPIRLRARHHNWRGEPRYNYSDHIITPPDGSPYDPCAAFLDHVTHPLT